MNQPVLKSSFAIAVLAISSLAIGQVVYSDGLTHTIPGDPAFTSGQWISLQSASSLIIQTGAQVSGAEGTGNQSSTGGNGITGLTGTDIEQLDGEVTGGDATTNGNLTSISPISATGGDGVRSAGSYTGSGGTVNGGIAVADGLHIASISVVSDIVEATGGAAVSLTSGATATFDGVTLNGGESFAYTALVEARGFGGPALRLNDSGPITVLSGDFTGGTGNAEIQFVDSGSAVGLGGACFEVNGSSTLTIESGTFHGGIGAGVIIFDNDESGTGIGAAALKITGPSNVTVNGGTFTVGSAAAGTIPPEEPINDYEGTILVTGDNSAGDLLLTINGGTFTGLYGLQTNGARPNSLNSRIDIFGGEFVGNDFDGDDFDISLSNPDILTTIYGTDFSIDGNPVSFGLISEMSGTLVGVLADSSIFEWTFEKFGDAPLMLAAVPEPTSLALLLSTLPLLLRRR